MIGCNRLILEGNQIGMMYWRFFVRIKCIVYAWHAGGKTMNTLFRSLQVNDRTSQLCRERQLIVNRAVSFVVLRRSKTSLMPIVRLMQPHHWQSDCAKRIWLYRQQYFCRHNASMWGGISRNLCLIPHLMRLKMFHCLLICKAGWTNKTSETVLDQCWANPRRNNTKPRYPRSTNGSRCQRLAREQTHVGWTNPFAVSDNRHSFYRLPGRFNAWFSYPDYLGPIDWMKSRLSGRSAGVIR